MPACPEDFLADTSYQAKTVDSEISSWVCEKLGSVNVERNDPNDNGSLLIIRTASHPWEVIDDWNLMEVAGSKNLERYLFMPLGYEILTDRNETQIPTTDFTSEFSGFVEAVQKHSCETIYLQVSPHTRSEHLVLLIRDLRPDVRLIVEFYDMGVLYSPDRLMEGSNYGSEEWELTRLAAWVASTKADAVVTKLGGSDWKRLSGTFNCPAFTWYPMHSKLKLAASQWPSSGLTCNAKKMNRIVFAGSMGDTELTKGSAAAPDANFLETFATIMRDKDSVLGIFNAADRRLLGGEAQKYEAVESWFSQFDSRHSYSPALPEDDLIDVMKEYDFGFFCVHYADPIIEHVGRLAIPNRAMAYLCAGLPIIADSYVEAMSELITQFNAGLVIDPADFDELSSTLKNTDTKLMRTGAANLRQHIIVSNTNTLDEIKKIVSQ